MKDLIKKYEEKLRLIRDELADDDPQLRSYKFTKRSILALEIIIYEEFLAELKLMVKTNNK
jgi:hypothetical protein